MTAFGSLALLSFSLICLVNCSYYIYFLKLGTSKKSKVDLSNTSTGVSVIICAKNESENLAELIPSLLTQAYPQFEILIVNDHSTDSTFEILQRFEAQDPRIKAVNLKNETGKKAGITLAIENAAYKKLLFTDADCVPATNDWIRLMSERLKNEKELVLGYSGYFTYKKSWLNKIIRFETILTAMQYFAYAENKNPYMGVGRNLAYTKKIFDSVDGFAKHQKIKAGDDDLFVNQTASADNIALCCNPEAFTFSKPKKTWRDWFIQKRRHTDIAKHYKFKHQLQLGVFYTSQFLFFTLALVLIGVKNISLFIFSILIARTLFVWFVTAKAAGKLQEKELIPYIAVLEPYLVYLQMIIFITNTLAKPKRWN